MGDGRRTATGVRWLSDSTLGGWGGARCFPFPWEAYVTSNDSDKNIAGGRYLLKKIGIDRSAALVNSLFIKP